MRISLHSSIRSISIGIFFATVFVIVNSISAWAQCDRPLINGWIGAWEPFILGTPDNPSGLDVEILEAIVAKAGCTIKHSKEIPWKRHLKQIEKGTIDLATSASWKEDRAKYAYFTFPYRAEYVALYIRKGESDKHPIKNIEDLLTVDFKLGVGLGDSFGVRTDEILKKMGKRVQRVSNTEDMNRKKLLKKRIDGYLGWLPSDPIELKQKGFDNKIEQHPMTLINTGDIYIMLSKKNNSYKTLEALNTGIVKIKADGTYYKIMKKYSDKYGITQW